MAKGFIDKAIAAFGEVDKVCRVLQRADDLATELTTPADTGETIDMDPDPDGHSDSEPREDSAP